MKLCKICNNTYSDGFAFCPKCGGPLIEHYCIKCPNCENLLEDNFIYCPYCGFGLNSKAENGNNNTAVDGFDNEDVTTNSDNELRLGIESEKKENHEEAYLHFGKAISLGSKEALIWYIASPQSHLLEEDNIDTIRSNVDNALRFGYIFKFKETFQQMCNIADSLEITGLLKEDEYECSLKNEFYKVAFKLREYGAKHGNLDAFCSVAWAYEKGIGVEENYGKAFTWYEKAANQGHLKSIYHLGIMYRDGKGVMKNLEKAKELFQNAQNQGYEEAQFALKRMIDNNDIAKENENDIDSLYSFGEMYYYGRGVPQDFSKAAECYRKAAEKGNAKSQFSFGVMLENGKGVLQNYAKAAEWYKKAAEQGHAIAQFNLGVMYYHGRGVLQNYTKAAEWYKKAAEQGIAQAQFNLGHMYYHGQGVSQDYTIAVEWLMKSAKQGNAWAQNDLGHMYYHGKGISRDYTKAAEWFMKSAEQGYALAQNSLGALYEEGEGVLKNYDEALRWYQKAADQGDNDAKDALERLKCKKQQNSIKLSKIGLAISEFAVSFSSADENWNSCGVKIPGSVVSYFFTKKETVNKQLLVGNELQPMAVGIMIRELLKSFPNIVSNANLLAETVLMYPYKNLDMSLPNSIDEMKKNMKDYLYGNKSVDFQLFVNHGRKVNVNVNSDNKLFYGGKMLIQRCYDEIESLCKNLQDLELINDIG